MSELNSSHHFFFLKAEAQPFRLKAYNQTAECFHLALLHYGAKRDESQ